MTIGDKILLHKIPFPDLQKEKDLFMEVEIIETRMSYHIWGKGKSPGFKAKGTDGRIYYCCWESFPDNSISPYYMWFMIPDNYNPDTNPELKAEDWYDVTYITMTKQLTSKPIFIDQFPNSIGWCQKHRELYHTGIKNDRYKCFKCFSRKEEFKEEEKQNWQGWY